MAVRCAGCGTRNPPGAALCSGCARPLDTASQTAVVQQRAAHTATGIVWSRVLLALLIIIILVVAIAVIAVHVL